MSDDKAYDIDYAVWDMMGKHGMSCFHCTVTRFPGERRAKNPNYKPPACFNQDPNIEFEANPSAFKEVFLSCPVYMCQMHILRLKNYEGAPAYTVDVTKLDGTDHFMQDLKRNAIIRFVGLLEHFKTLRFEKESMHIVVDETGWSHMPAVLEALFNAIRETLGLETI